MLGRKACVGLSLCAFGAGLILAAFFSSFLCPVLLGLGCIGAGVLLGRCVV